MADEERVIAPAASSLGTKEYWDSRYDMELSNFEDCGDEGEVWFGRSAENRIVKYLLDTKCSKDSRILDLGCGNGSVLRRLRAKGFTNLVGVDYCPAAVELSRKASEQDAEEEGYESGIQFEVLDILSSESRSSLNGDYGFVLDKGTWDAMSLSDERESRRQAYLMTVQAALVSDGNGRLVIFSCNFTCEELRGLFECKELVFETEIPASHSFAFGGKEGVTSAGAVFRRV